MIMRFYGFSIENNFNGEQGDKNIKILIKK